MAGREMPSEHIMALVDDLKASSKVYMSDQDGNRGLADALV
jgi:hypothetical protein